MSDDWAMKILQDDLNEALAEIARLRTALRIIAGQEQCIDNLMSNVDVAREALEQKADNP